MMIQVGNGNMDKDIEDLISTHGDLGTNVFFMLKEKNVMLVG